MTYPDVFIVIVVHNRVQITRGCLLSLTAQSYTKFKIVVVDDGSSDGTEEMIRTEFPDVIILKGDGNLWWSGGTNLGVSYSLKHGSQYIITLNDDTLPDSDFVLKMVESAHKRKGCLIGASAVDIETQKTIYCGERINWALARYDSLLNDLSQNELFGLHEVTHFPGRGLIIPAEVFNKHGLYDSNNFPQLAADYDFTHKVVRAGVKIYCDLDIKLKIYHYASGDVQYRKKRNLKNYIKHLFDIKGGGNLKIFIKYAVKNCPKHLLFSFLLFGLIRRIFGYWLVRNK